MIPSVVNTVGAWLGVTEPGALAIANAVVLGGLIIAVMQSLFGAAVGIIIAIMQARL